MAKERQIKTRSAAMGCTIRMEDRLVRVEAGREKSSATLPVKRPSEREVSHMQWDTVTHGDNVVTRCVIQPCSPVLYPTCGPSQASPLQ